MHGERIIDKLFTYDVEFSNKMSKGTVLNTISGDVSNLSEMYISVSETIIISIKVKVMIVVFMLTNVYVGLAVILLENLVFEGFPRTTLLAELNLGMLILHIEQRIGEVYMVLVLWLSPIRLQPWSATAGAESRR